MTIAVSLPIAVTIQGALIGAMYGLLAVGLVLVYRSSRVINFAHGELGAFGAAVFALLVSRWGLPYWLMLPVAMGASALVSGAAEVAAVRRLRAAPALMSVVATLGIGQVVLLLADTVNPDAATGTSFPEPPFLPTLEIGSFTMGPAYVAMAVLGPLTVVGLGAFVRRGRTGRALRAAAANPDAARLDGVAAARMSTIAWMLAGGLSAMTAILVSPTRGFVAASSFGPSLLLRALVASVIARMDRPGIAFVAGVGLGIVEQQLLWNTDGAGVVELVLFVIVVVGMLLVRPVGGRRADRTTWLSVRPWRPAPREVASLKAVRWAGPLVAIVGAAVAAASLLVVTNATAYVLVAIFAFAVIGLSVTITSGLLGELSLGMFAVGGIAAGVSIPIATNTGSFPLAFAAATIAGAVVALVLGLPSIRSPGLLLTVTTLAFAIAAQQWAFPKDWLFADGVRPGQPVIGTLALDTGRTYAAFALAVLVLALALAWNVRRSGVGRRYVAVRDNDDAARAFGVRARWTKAQALAVGGAFAGLGGALYAHSLPLVSAGSFPVTSSIDVVAVAALGGIGLVAGPVLGALYVVGVPRFLPLDSAGLAATALGWLLFVLYVPGGIASLVAPLRRRWLRSAAARTGIDPGVIDAGAPERAGTVSADTLVVAPARTAQTGTLLRAIGVRRRFGGVVAVDGVDLDVEARSIVGLIGPNGAGKTTLFELIAGFTSCDSGRIELGGVDVTGWTPERRARAGLVRSFQDAALFPSLTVHETVQLALERRHPSRLATALVGLDRRARTRADEADALVAAMGLGPWRDIATGELSTGTRRITELACLVALEPVVLLLDEPSSGLAQREVEAMRELLPLLRDRFGITIVLIEHDIPLVMAVADRVVALALGRVLREGAPAAVRDDPLVIETYLGSSTVAVGRSGPVAVDAPPAGHA